MYRAYKYRLYPTDEQKSWFGQAFAAVRSVYNAALEQRKTYGRAKGTDAFNRDSSFSQPRQSRELNFRTAPGRPGLKDDPDLEWLTAAPRDCFDAALRDLDKAFKNFFSGRAGFPSFRNADRNNSLSFKAWSRKNVDGKKVAKPVIVFGQHCVTIPKVGRVRYKRHRKFYGDPKTIEIVREGPEYYVILTAEQPDPEINHIGEAVGVDIGVALPVALSNGEIVLPDSGLLKIEKRLRKEQRRLSRARKGSNRRKGQKHLVGDLKRLQARRRAAFAHRISNELTRRFSLIAVEDLRIQNMTASAKGSVEKPGSMVKQKAGLNRAILNVAPFQLRTQIEYKALRTGSKVVVVDPKYTSMTCPACNCVSAENRASQSQFQCVECGHAANADVNAARNILMRATKSAGVPARRKPPSEFHQKSATAKVSVSCFQPTSVLEIMSESRSSRNISGGQHDFVG